MESKYIVIEHIGEDGFSLWFTDDLGNELDGGSVRGSWDDIFHELHEINTRRNNNDKE